MFASILDFSVSGCSALMHGMFGLLAQADTATLSSSLDPRYKLLIAVLLIGGSYFIGRSMSKWLRMPDYGGKIGLVAFALLAGIVITVLGWPPKLGIDLSGGVILNYELDPQRPDKDEPVDMDQLIPILARRIDPGNTKQITIRPSGPEQIEIIIPRVGKEEIEQIKRNITNLGSLEFRIVANRRDHADMITKAEALPLTVSDVKDSSGKTIGRFVPVDNKPDTIERFSSSAYTTRVIKREGEPDELQVLVRIDPINVTGEYLLRRRITAGVDERGTPSVNFAFDSTGARKFGNLTKQNLPDEANGFFRQLAILLDERLVSAPQIRSVITDSGQITGDFTQQQVNDLVGVLRAGALPAQLNRRPVSELTTSATLGADVVRRSTFSMVISMGVVLVFMLFYYRFAGIVACAALLMNLVLIVAVMISIEAAFTLPGMAGLVLTVGMAVDANVLIFERIREELNRGAALRMAIRNGFARATTTIVDANLTTLITGVILFWMGSDQIKGFAVTLILGILMSMFTAIYCARLVFDIAERRRRLNKLTMMQMLAQTNIDFISKQKVAAAFSIALIAIGLVAVFARGQGLLGIDFTGGTSATIVFDRERESARDVSISVVRSKVNTWNDQANKVQDLAQLRELLGEKALGEIHSNMENEALAEKPIDQMTPEEFQTLAKMATLPDLAVSEVEDLAGDTERSRYRLDTSNRSIESVEAVLTHLFEGQLASNDMQFEEIAVAKLDTPAISTPGGAGQPAETPKEDAKPAEDTTPDDKPAEDAKPDADDSSATLEEAAGLLALADGPVLLAQNETETPASDTPAANTSAADKPADTPAADKPADDTPTIQSMEDSPGTRSRAELTFSEEIGYDSLRELIQENLDNDVIFNLENIDYRPGSTLTFKTWEVEFNVPWSVAAPALDKVKQQLAETPFFPATANIGANVAGDTRTDAGYALFSSLIMIVGYIWIRFQRVTYGLAAVVALVHDVLITLGFLAISQYLSFIPYIDPFKLSLPIMAAFLTIVGYSLNDTIVVFDRIRETRGKSPVLTADMINASINQTLSRTLLTSLTTLIVVVILFFFGGQGIHGFAFALVVGVMVGTYSSIFIASPVLLYLSKPTAAESAKQQAIAGRAASGVPT